MRSALIIRNTSLFVVCLLIASFGVFVPAGIPSAHAAGPGLALTKTGPGSILVGDSGTFTLSAANGGPGPEYNVSFRDVLPVGVLYQGPTSPGDIGEPTVIGDGVNQPETLIWSDTFDLQPNATNAISFGVAPSTAHFPVGSSFANAADVYGSSDPRRIPPFDANGQPISDPAVTSVHSNSVTTSVTALKITKDEPSPEGELLRGVHDQSTVYTLTVTDNPVNPTQSVTVTDYLPAEQEFLGCGGTDNSAAGTTEYPGAPRLTVVPVVTTDCPAPTSVDTVVDPPGHTGVFTKVVWDLGTLTTGQAVTIKYRAGIPLRKNVAFSPGTPTSGVQAANLDNNTGAPTRQVGSGAASTNFVQADGSYTGPAVGGNPAVEATGQHTVTVHDVRIHKGVAPATFASGNVATYTLTIDAGEYEDASNLQITDVLPNGVCPLDDVANYAPSTPDNSDCAPAPPFAPTDAYQSVTEQAGVGTFTVDFVPIASLARDSSTTITYFGRMRRVYTDGPLQGEPTAAGDSFTNHAVQTSDTNPGPGNNVDSGQVSVTDPTSATQTTGGPQLSKQIGERAVPMDCNGATYRGLVDPIPPDLTFAQGDRVCFRITVTFSQSVDARNPVLTDFLPDNLSYEPNSFTAGPDNTLAASQFGFDEATAASTSDLTWTLGHLTGQGQLQVDKGTVFQAQFSALVVRSAAGPAPDKVGNLAKFREVNSVGEALSLRDQVNFEVTTAPISIKKGVASRNGTVFSPPADGVQVREGDALVFDVDVANTSDPATSPPAADITSADVWDVLPAGIECSAVTNVSDFGACTDPGDPAHPTFTGSGTHSAIVWSGAVTIAPGATHTYNYTVTMPTGTSVASDLVNTAYVRSYDVATDGGGGGTATHYPASNIDPNLPPSAVLDPQPASDPSDVVVPAASVTKQVRSAVAEANNAGLETPPGAASTQGVPGESVTYTVSARIPAHTTVFNGTLTDTLPAGVSFDASTAQFAPDAANPVYTALPAGTTFDGVTTISLGASYDNTTGTDQLFTITITAHLNSADTTNIVQGGVRTNIGRFSSTNGGTALPDQVATASVSVVEPAPTLTKTNDKAPPSTVTAGTAVTYTLTAGNPASRPPLHNGWVVDCLPGALTFAAFTTVPAGTTATTQPGSNGSTSTAVACATGTTEIDWNVGDLAPGASSQLKYSATVNPGAAGSVSYTNTANLTGNSLAGTRSVPTDPGAALGRTYTKTATSTVKVASAGITKSATPTRPTIGDQVTYTVTVTLPANVTFFNLSVIDTLPTAIVPVTTPPPATVGCTNADSSACGVTTATPLTGTGAKVGWLLGDVPESTQVRTVTLTYQTKIADVPAATAGAAPANSAIVAWDTSTATPPTTTAATFDQSAGPATAPVTVQEPNLSVAKAVSTNRPQPGDTFGYTVTVTNANTANTSAAYDVTVTDAVPVGVVVDPASISGGGSLTGAGPTTGGGTISWTIAGPLAKNDFVNRTYSARLAPSSTLTGAGLRNTATLTGYDSLPSGGRHYAPNRTAQATVTPAFPSLSAAKAATDGPLTYIGSPYRWTSTVTNAPGAGKAVAVGAVDTLPPNWTYDGGSATVAVNGGAATPVDPNVTTNGNTQTMTFENLASLDGGQSLVITYTATPGADVATSPGVGHSVDQTNTVSPTGTDPTGATSSAGGSFLGGPATAVTHIDSADISMTKSVGTAPTAGQDATWTLSVANNGPDTAVGPFSVTDPFAGSAPAGVTIVDVTGVGWTCTPGPISCARTAATDTLASGASFPPITVHYHVAANVPGGTTLDNTASVDARTFDPDTTNNDNDASTTVATLADLGIDKILSDPPVVPGSLSTYTVTVTNYGPSVSRGPITVTDTLPGNSTVVSADGPGWACPTNATGGAITCTRAADLDPATSAPELTIRLRIASGQMNPVVNSATVQGTTPEPAPDTTHPDTDSVTSTPQPDADLEIAKQLLDPPVVAGGTAHYRITVTNHGPSDAQHVVVTDTLPALLTFDSVTDGADWTCSHTGQQVECDYTMHPALAAGATSSFTLVADVGQQFQGTVTNTAAVTSDTPDPDPTNNSATSNSGVTNSADLSVTKTHTGTAVAGQIVTFSIGVHNHGPSDEAGDITVTDPLPDHTSFVSANGQGWTCAEANRTITCTGGNNLANGADSSDITVVLGLDPDAGPATVVNTASVTGNPDSPDPNPTNNAAPDQVDVTVATDVALTKALDTATPVVAGTAARFTLQATNNGPSDATSITVEDTLPQYLSFATAEGAGWVCDHAGQLITCTRDRLPADPPADPVAPIVVVANVDQASPDGTTVQNTAQISTGSPGTPSQPGPVDVPIVRQADLSIRKSVDPGSVAAGSDVTWHITVANAGPSEAAGPITVVDTLPDAESLVSSAGPWTCTPDGTDPHTVTCVRTDPLAAGARDDTLTLTVHVADSADVGTETNTVNVASPTPDPDPSNNATTAPVTVTRSAVLSIAKSHAGRGVVGHRLTFTLAVHNDGPSRADQVVVTDDLPSGLRYVAARGAGWACSTTGAAVICSLAGYLDPHADAAPVTVVTTVLAGAYPSVTNTATVRSDDSDLASTDTADDPVTVDPDAQLALTKRHRGNLLVGQDATYVITVRDVGPTNSPGPIVVSDPLPTGLDFVSVHGTGWDCSTSGAKVRCVHAAGLALHASSRITLHARVLTSAYPQVVNTAEVTGPGSTRTTDSDPARVRGGSVVRLVKKLVSYTDSVATYSISLINDGPGPTSRTARIIDPLPDGLQLISANGPGWTCASSGTTVACRHPGPIGVDNSATVTLKAQVTASAGSKIVNIANGGVGNQNVSSNPVPVSSPALASTGAQVAQGLTIAVALVVLGGVALALGRRRKGSS